MSSPEEPDPAKEEGVGIAALPEETVEDGPPAEPKSSQEHHQGFKIVGPDNEEIHLEDIVTALDGGYGWIIVMAAFLSNLIVDGTIFSFGILLGPISANTTSTSGETNTPPSVSEVAWVGSITTAFYCGAGPFVSSCSNLFGFRATAMAGSIVAFTGLTLAWFFNRNADIDGPNMISLYICYGFIGGVGMSMLYVPSIITVGFYFEKKRALATGIAVCGSGVGTFIYAPFIQALIHIPELNWAGAILIEGCILLCCIFIASLYRPLKPIKHPPPLVTTSTLETGGSVESIQRGLPLAGSTTVIVKYELANGNKASLISSSRGFQQSQIGIHEPNVIRLRSGSQARLSQASPIQVDQSFSGDSQDDLEHSPGAMPLTWGSSESVGVERNTSVQSTKGILPRITILVGSGEKLNLNKSESRVYRLESKERLNKPLFRSDIFYPGGLETFTDNEEEENNFPNIELEARVISKEESLVNKPKKGRCYKFPVLRKMLDFSLLKSPTFLEMMTAIMCQFMGVFVPFIYLKEIVKTNDVTMDNNEATFLISIIGIANTFGRVICGYGADKLSKYVLIINTTALTVAGVSTILVPFYSSYSLYVVYSVVFGLCVACFVSLRSILVVEVLGLNKLTNAVGLLLLFGGSASLIGSPLAGYLKESTGSYSFSFFVAGTFLLLAGAAFSPLHYVNAWDKKRVAEKKRLKALPI